MSLPKASCIYSPKYTTFHSLVGNILYIVMIAPDTGSKLDESSRKFKGVDEDCLRCNLAALDLTVLRIPSWFALSHHSHPPLL